MPKDDYRIPWQEYFMRIAYLVRERSTCLRRKVGCVLVKDGLILATGYNGAPAGIEHCANTGCLREQLHVPSGQRHEICRGVHAEQNVIVQAARHGTPIQGAEIYCTTMPCSICTKLLINCGITTIYYCEGYNDELSQEMLSASNIAVERMDIPAGADCQCNVEKHRT